MLALDEKVEWGSMQLFQDWFFSLASSVASFSPIVVAQTFRTLLLEGLQRPTSPCNAGGGVQPVVEFHAAGTTEHPKT
jgi:hypothetical protein